MEAGSQGASVEAHPDEGPWARLARRRVSESMVVKQEMLADREWGSQVDRALTVIAASARAGHKLLLCGNGGSACDAQHIAEELLGRFRRERAAWPAVCLGTNMGALTAIANDYGYEWVFSRELQAQGRPGDVLLALSTSGRSPSMLRAAEAARALGLVVVAWTGAGGGPLAALADIAVRVPSDDAAHIQEAHITLGHVLAEVVERALAGE